MNFRVTLEVIVETGREGIAQRAHLPIDPPVLGPCPPRNLKRVIYSIFIQSSIAVNFRGSAKCEDEVFFDAPEVVFSFSVGKTKCRTGIGATKDMRDAVSIAIDSDTTSKCGR